MFENFSYDASLDVSLNHLNDFLDFIGDVFAEHWRDGKLLGKYKFNNGITGVGKNLILNAMFNSATQIAQSSWCIGIIDNTSFSALSASDTMASHAGWIEFTTYSESTRVAWGPTSSTAQTVANTTAATFDITGTGTLYGIFVTSQNTLGGTTGTLWSTAAFPSTIPVTAGDFLMLVAA